jgi:hypothetical protein
MKTNIYLVQCGKFAKIGKANNPIARWRSLQTGSPEKILLIGWIKASPRKEKELHRRFARQRTRGEWFHWGPEIEAFAETLTPYEMAAREPKDPPPKWRARLRRSGYASRFRMGPTIKKETKKPNAIVQVQTRLREMFLEAVRLAQEGNRTPETLLADIGYFPSMPGYAIFAEEWKKEWTAMSDPNTNLIELGTRMGFMMSSS